MSSNDDPKAGSDESHLVRADGPSGIRSLSPATGMQRLYFNEVRLDSGDSLTLGAADAELFVYVLGGRGIARSRGETLEVVAGDFLAADDIVEITNPSAEQLIVVCGGENC